MLLPAAVKSLCRDGFPVITCRSRETEIEEMYEENAVLVDKLGSL